PDLAIDAVFSPPYLIGLDGRTGPDLPFERIKVGLHLVFEPVQQFHDLANADPHPVQGEQVHLDLSNGQTHHRAQRRDQTGQSHADASLAVPSACPSIPPNSSATPTATARSGSNVRCSFPSRRGRPASMCNLPKA